MSAGRVLVVGAGPVGLATACELAQQGVEVRIVDQQVSASDHSRAAIVWPRQLELLRRIGVTFDLINAGHRIDAVSFYSEGRRRGGIDLTRLRTSIHPFAITVPQTTTEEILTARLVSHGIEVERGTTVVGIQGVDHEPAVTMRRGSGSTETSSFEWVVGADGAHSTVRRLLAIPFTPTSTDLRFGICDVRVDDGPQANTMHYYYSSAGAVGLAPMRGGIFRIAMSLPSLRIDGAVPPPPVREDFQKVLDTRAPGSGSIGKPEWTAAFDVRFGTAEKFRRGRCFLVGDAAHIMSPAGGQGMNTGLQDAINLGWKLAAVVSERVDSSLLETYELERRSAALQVTRSTGIQTRLGLIDHSVRRRIRDVSITVADRAGLLQYIGAPVLSQLDVTYASSRFPVSPRRGLRPGDRVPAFAEETPPVGRTSPLWPTLHPTSPTVLLWPGLRSQAGWPRFVVGVADALPETACVDVSELGNAALVRQFGRSAHAFLCRPDGHLAARSRIASPDEAGVASTARSIRPFVTRSRTMERGFA